MVREGRGEGPTGSITSDFLGWGRSAAGDTGAGGRHNNGTGPGSPDVKGLEQRDHADEPPPRRNALRGVPAFRGVKPGVERGVAHATARYGLASRSSRPSVTTDSAVAGMAAGCVAAIAPTGARLTCEQEVL